MAQKKKAGAPRMKAGTAKTVDKDVVVANLKGTSAGRRKRARIPEGQYLVKLGKAENRKTKTSNNDMVVWQFEITGGSKYDGTFLWYNTVLTDESLWSFRGVLEALGVKVKDSTMKIPLSRLFGRECGVEVVDGEPYNNRISSEINDLFPADQLEEEDEDEEEYEEDDEEEYEEDEDEEDEDEEDEEDDEEIDLDEEEL